MLRLLYKRVLPVPFKTCRLRLRPERNVYDLIIERWGSTITLRLSRFATGKHTDI
jgi:hypothetical protein